MKTYQEWLQDSLISEQEDHVPQITLGKTGLRVGRLAWGSGTFYFNPRNTQREVETIINTFSDAGCNLLDTCTHYPNDAEGRIGRAIKGRRDQFVLLTKVGHNSNGLPGKDWSPSLLANSINRSLKRLQTDYIDIVLLHTPEMNTLKEGEVYDVLLRAKEAGKIGHFGNSGDNEEVEFSATVPELDVIETSLNICELANVPVLKTLNQKKIGILAKRSIANACWKPRSRQYQFSWEYSQPYRERLPQIGVTPKKMGLPDNSDHSWVKMCLPFTMSHPIHVAIVGSTNIEHIREDIEIAKLKPNRDMINEISKMWHEAHENAPKYKTGYRWTGQM